MPFTTNQGARIYWDEQGKGEPLLMIMGHTYASAMWHRIRPLLNVNFHTIAFDNRGSGHSDVPAGPYPIPLMASDAWAVLDAANIENAHVFGVSMGGMIAQEFAIQYPRRVRSRADRRAGRKLSTREVETVGRKRRDEDATARHGGGHSKSLDRYDSRSLETCRPHTDRSR
jgi:pimeloyl-ACP methyl ester carboxylesterase